MAVGTADHDRATGGLVQPGHTTKVNDLLELMRAGDRQNAGRLLIEHACERLHLLAHRMLRRYPHVHRWEETDDVFVEATTRLHRSLADVLPESPKHFYNLAATHVRRVLIEMARKHFGSLGVGANHESDAQGDGRAARHDPADATGEPSSIAEWTEFHEQVELLPDEEREVFSLTWYEGLSQCDIANVLGIGIRTVKRRWQSARCLLGKALQGESLNDGRPHR
jgi:RNA polymerase sigma-70 factor (ECF subfamily)